MNQSLADCFSRHLQYQQDDVLQAFVDEINSQLNAAVVGVVFYGSCMRSREYKDAMLDFYVVVDQYSHAYPRYWHRVANRLLPPNVFFVQTQVGDEVYRAKYAVVSQQDLLNEVGHAFHSYFWARFTQPIACIYARSEAIKSYFIQLQCAAAHSFYRAVLPQITVPASSEAFWVKGLQLTYAAELRAETQSRAELIYSSDREFYDDIYTCLIAEQKNTCRVGLNKVQWKVRIYLGKLLSIARLLKAATTFVGGIDYLAWKVERHTGEVVTVSNKMRKYPWIYAWPTLFSLLKRGKIR